MKDEKVAILYKAARDIVEAIGMEAFKDFGEIENADTKKRLDQLKYAVKLVQGHVPTYPKPWIACLTDDVHYAEVAFKTEQEASSACHNYMLGFMGSGVRSCHYYDRRKIWE